MSEATTIDGIDYGPLAGLIGVWEGDKGVDRAPEPDGEERNPYYETIVFEPAGDVDNAETQVLAIVRYQQTVRRKSNDKVFHNQVGYWCWDSSDNSIFETFVIPRGVGVVAEGNCAPPASPGDEVVLEVATASGPETAAICQADFMLKHAKTTGFTHTLKVKGDEMSYTESTMLDIYDRKGYDHKDLNTLRRVG